MFYFITITCKTSLGNRLVESVDQTNRVVVNVCTTYNPRLMATQIKNYFDTNPLAVEVLIYKGMKAISVTRRFTENPLYMFLFRQKYIQ